MNFTQFIIQITKVVIRCFHIKHMKKIAQISNLMYIYISSNTKDEHT